ncbi:MAG TPA: DNA polymerase III subunit gamma/tau [Cyanobacteria bacterium UBA12227]|nr:DNA polymerase III subunit gamma/tau [Cyanobacteria bacterium UBA12227]HAX90413.1 DNA polymerase III subunit gamma/tau [Cyanobacteria bacterium UBA11370]HBY75561.1 DNA polymerase III subunit gamma/tau [Cyanobacteria bacterium UBA11148]
MVSYEPLHHKYRPQTFANLVGQEAIATTLINAIHSRRIAPAYLFTGPRGTGKTSSARILAKSLNCINSSQPTAEPCGTCHICREIASGSALDVTEIDAASNTGVDNIRDLIEKAQFSPVQCRYKVYIIDEVHMLSTAAFNALLKTLEEPPKHVVFVLATTDPQRVLATIISRCQRFDFRRIPLDAMVQHLQDIAAKEKININPDAITLVAQIAQGGLRDAESLLDQLSLLPGQVTVEQVWDLVGSVPERDLLELTKAIAYNNSESVIDHCRKLMDRGREPLIVLQNLASFYRDLLIARTASNRSDLVAVTPPTWKQLCEFAQELEIRDILQGQQHLKNSEVQIKNTTQPRLWLELTLLGLLPSANLGSTHQSERSTITQLKTSTATSPQTNSASTIHTPQPIQSATPTNNTSTSEIPNPVSQVQSDPTKNASPPATVNQEQPQQTSPTVQPHRSENNVTQTAQATGENELFNLEQIWQDVLANIDMIGTRSLLNQQGYLIEFNGTIARIGIRSEPWLKEFQNKLPKIEAAFKKVYNQKVTVKFQVGLIGQATTKDSVKEPSSPIITSESQQNPTVEQATNNYLSYQQTNPISPDRVTDNEEEPNPKTSSSSVGVLTSPPTPPQTQVETVTSNPTLTAIEYSTPLKVEVPEWEPDQVKQTLDTLEKFFDGEIIDLATNVDTSESLMTLSTPASQEIIDLAIDTPELEATFNDSEDFFLSDSATGESLEEIEEIEEIEEACQQLDAIVSDNPIAEELSEIIPLQNTPIPPRGRTLIFDETGDLAF